MAMFFYVRVSAFDQHLDRQLIAASGHGIPSENVFTEKLSGKDTKRPELQRLMMATQSGDSVIVESISRFARNTRDLLDLVEKLNTIGVEFISLKENIDTTTPTGKFMLTVFGAVAELERGYLLQRQTEGIAAAKLRGVRFGRPMKRTFIITLSLLMMLALVACASESSDSAEVARLRAELDALRRESDDSKSSPDAETQEPESTAPSVFRDSLPPPSATASEPTPSAAPIPTPEPEVWTIRYYVDSFRQETDEAYIVNEDDFIGVFSNSATTNSRLDARLLVDKDDIAIILFEYGRNMVQNSSSRNSVSYAIVMRTEDDTRTEMTGSIPPGANRILVDSRHHSRVISALSGTGTIDFYIVQTDRTTTNYLFQVTAGNFSDIYESFR